MKSTRFAYAARTTFGFYIFFLWAAVVTSMCVIIPLKPELWYSSDPEEHCAPDGSFRMKPINPWSPSWFFQVVIGFGSLSFTLVKAIDLGWDVVVGRGGQALLAYISWKTFSKYVYSYMMTNPISYQTFWAVFIRDDPSLWSIFHTTKDLTMIKGLASKSVMVFIILTMIFILIFPILASAMTGYSANNRAMVNTIGVNQAPFSQFFEARYVIHDGDRIGKSARYAVGSLEDERTLCGTYDCINNYIKLYGVSQLRESTFGQNKAMMIDLDLPTLSITSYSENSTRRPFVFEGQLYYPEYFTANDNAICQPNMHNGQQTYQWGFSILQLEITLCLLLLWTFGVYIMSASTNIRLFIMGIAYDAPGNIKSSLTLADTIRKEFKEQHDKDADSLTRRELASQIKTGLNGGRVMLQAPIYVLRQSQWG